MAIVVKNVTDGILSTGINIIVTNYVNQ